MKIVRTDTLKAVQLNVSPEKSFQEIDGFGMNINPQYWEEGVLIPVMELFHEDLEATLYRLDVFGQSNWIDPDNTAGKGVLNEETYRRVYTGKAFQDAWTMARYLNEKGIKPYLNASGIVPVWMCAEDGKTLTDFAAFSEMMASMLHWARHVEGVDFELFGPLNETDIGPPEGPFLAPEPYAQCCEVLVDTLQRWGLGDVKLVVAEQAKHGLEYARHLFASKRLLGKIAVVGMHTYSEARFDDVPQQLEHYPDRSTRFWMTEYGDLDETGEIEWEVAVRSTRRLLWALLDGAQAGLVWDAFDNYHDHDKAWTLYGLLRRGRREYTPKKRYYAAKQIYKYVKLGSRLVGVQTEGEGLLAAAFEHKAHGLTIVGIQENDVPVHVCIKLEAASTAELPFQGIFTNENLNAAEVGMFSLSDTDGFLMLKVLIPERTIFTLSQSRVAAK